MTLYVRRLTNIQWFPTGGSAVIRCLCGHSEEVRFEHFRVEINLKKRFPKCPSCSTEHLVEWHDQYFFHVLEKSRTRGDVVVYHFPYDSRELEKITRIQYDLVEHKLYFEKNGEMILIKNQTQSNRVFREFFDNENHHSIFRLADHLGTDLNNICPIANFGTKFFQYVHSLPLQVLVGSGYGHWGNALFSKEIIQSKESKPHSILGIPKVVLNEVKSLTLSKSLLQNVQTLAKKYDGQDLKAGFDLVKNEYKPFDTELLKSVAKLVCEEDVLSFQRFIRYLFIETKHRQGITNPMNAIQILNDSIVMAKEMNVDYELMPRSLKVMHDLLTMNYNVVRSEIEQEKFLAVVQKESYKSLEFDGDDFIILSPRSENDLVQEGRTLSHCVSSYFKRVMHKRSKIYFLREKKSPNSPLITIEVCGNKIHQVAGRSNRIPLSHEQDFILKWAKEKQLSYY